MSFLIETTSTNYSTDVSDEEWLLIRPFMPRNQPNGRDMTTSMRDVVNAIFYQNRTGCQWRLLPSDFPPHGTVARYYYLWMRDGTWTCVLDSLRERHRRDEGKKSEPTAGIVDSQSVKVPPQKGQRGYNGHKRINGTKRHLLVDTLGLMLAIVVTAANRDDREGATLIAANAKTKFPQLTTIWADSGYIGKKWHDWFLWWCNWTITIVKRTTTAKEFEIVPRRWVVERTFAWLDRYRRLSKDYEILPQSSETRCQLAMIRVLTRRIAHNLNPCCYA